MYPQFKIKIWQTHETPKDPKVLMFSRHTNTSLVTRAHTVTLDATRDTEYETKL